MTTQTPMRIAVAGATGRLGRHVVEVLVEDGHDVVAMSRSSGVDVESRDGLAEALAGVEVIIDAATGSSPDEAAATEFFMAATRNLHELGERAGVRRMVVVSIVGTDRVAAGYGAAKLTHEHAALAGPIPVRVVRATQFHEFVAQLLEWGTQGDVGYVPRMRTQLVAARSVAEVVAGVATSLEPDGAWAAAPIVEVAGPREENLAAMARLLVSRRGDELRIEEVSDPSDPNRETNEGGGLLPGPDAILAGPTYEDWLDTSGADQRPKAS